MASWTDKAPTFTPYVQQQPIEAMLKVGMYKQKQYDEGIEKIQTSIDNVAGIDIIRDVDKKYLKTKLTNLESKLRFAAGGDFSNSQLVNSITGMTNSIVNDKHVQNALISTQRYRMGISDMQAANRSGKGAPQNDYDFNIGASKWLNSENLEESFSGSYSPYVDYKKKELDIVKALVKDKIVSDEVFSIDSKGRKVLNDDMLRTELAGVSPERIQQVLMATLTPADFKQMGIDGRYNYANYSDAQFITKLETTYKTTINSLDDKIKGLQDLSPQAIEVSQKLQIEDGIKQLEKEKQRVKNDFETTAKSYEDGNTDGAKAMLETNNFINNFSHALSYTEISKTRETSPAAVMQYNREVQAGIAYRWSEDLKEKRRQFDITSTQKDREIDADEEANRIKNLGVSGRFGPVGQGGNQEKVKTTDFIDFNTNLNKNIKKDESVFMHSMGIDSTNLANQRYYWENFGIGDPLTKSYFEKHDADTLKVYTNNTMLAQIDAVVARNIGTIDDLIPVGDDPVTLNYIDGSVDFVAKEFVNFNRNFKDFKLAQTESTGTGASNWFRAPGYMPTSDYMKENVNITFDDNKAKNILSPKEYIIYEATKKQYYGQDLTNQEQMLVNASQYYNKTVNIPQQEKLREIEEARYKLLNDRLTAVQANAYTFSLPDDKAKQDMRGTLLGFNKLAKEQKGGLAKSPNFDSAVLDKILGGTKLVVTMDIADGTDFTDPRYLVNILGDDGENTQFTINQEQKNLTFPNDFNLTSEQIFANKALEQIAYMGGSSTTYNSTTDPVKTSPEKAWINSNKFPKVTKFGINGDIKPSTVGTGWSIRLNIYDPIRGKWINDIPYPLGNSTRTGILYDPLQFKPALDELTDDYIFTRIYGKVPSQEDWKMLEEASKKLTDGK